MRQKSLQGPHPKAGRHDRGGRGIGIAKRLWGRVMINDSTSIFESEARANPDRVSHITGDLTDPAIPELIVQATLGELGRSTSSLTTLAIANVVQKTTDECLEAMLDIHP